MTFYIHGGKKKQYFYCQGLFMESILNLFQVKLKQKKINWYYGWLIHYFYIKLGFVGSRFQIQSPILQIKPKTIKLVFVTSPQNIQK